jgi:hypothetical protein
VDLIEAVVDKSAQIWLGLLLEVSESARAQVVVELTNAVLLQLKNFGMFSLIPWNIRTGIP